jgi:hypothetical protein
VSSPRRPRPGPTVSAPVAPEPQTPAADEPLPGPLLALGVVALVVVAAVGAAVCVLLTPFRIGATLVPLAVVVAIGLNVVLPTLGHAMAGSRGLAAGPVVVFFVAGWALSIAPGGDVLLAGGSDGQTATSYATLLLGVLAGAVTSVRAR